MSEFNFGEKVRAKHDIENLLGVVKKGSIGVVVLSDPKHKEWSKLLFGKELFTFDFDGTIIMTDSEEVEKIEPENTETPKNENGFKKYTLTLKNRQNAVVFVGAYESVDEEFQYFSDRDGRSWEIRKDEIIMIVSEEIEQ